MERSDQGGEEMSEVKKDWWDDFDINLTLKELDCLYKYVDEACDSSKDFIEDKDILDVIKDKISMAKEIKR